MNFQVYKFKEAVAKKGEANARKHVGLVAQDIIEAFEAKGLNALTTASFATIRGKISTSTSR